MQNNLNPPAFPSHWSMGEVIQEGMTLRDWFAGQANENDIVNHMHFYGINREKARYSFADAMLSEREKAQ